MRIVVFFIAAGIAAVAAANTPIVPANLAQARGEHTATALASGAVLIAGGNDGDGRVAGTAIYDPDNNVWTTAGDLRLPRFLHTATLLPNGKVLVAGGTNGAVLGSAELFDPTGRKWTAAASMNTPRYSHTATLLPDGKVLVIGGNTDAGPAATAEIYDPASNAWMAIAGPIIARHTHTATLLASGRVLIVGGRVIGEAYTATAEIYDPVAQSWSMAPSLGAGRSDHTATLLADGGVLVVGGDTSGNVLRSQAERYDPVRAGWTNAGSIARKLHTATLLDSGSVLIVAGYNGSVALGTLAEYDPATNAWNVPMDDSLAPRWGHSTTVLPDNRLLTVGGYDLQRGYLANVAAYDPLSAAWAAAATGYGDATFGNGGIYAYPRRFEAVGPYTFDTRLVAPVGGRVLALGGIARNTLVGNASYLTSASFALTGNGALDTSFGREGTLPDPQTVGHRFTTAHELADGSMILASEVIDCRTPLTCGSNDPGPTYAVQRYLADGSLDTSYGQVGSYFATSHMGNAAILADGTTVGLGISYVSQALVTNNHYSFEAIVVDSRGQPDPALASRFLGAMIRCSPSGTATLSQTGRVPLVETTTNNRILFAYDGCMVRLNPDASLDASFGTGGVSTIDNAGLGVTRALVRKDGGVLTFAPFADGSSFRVVNRLPNGTADPEFGAGGVIARLALPFTPAQGSDASAGVRNATNSSGLPVLDAAERVLIAGTQVDGSSGETASYLARFDAAMNLDTSFGSAGNGLIEIGRRSLGQFTPFSAALDPWGRILLGGQLRTTRTSTANYVEMVTRLNADSTVVTVIEYYHPALDHYFITWRPDEIAKLDAGTESQGWVRTGYAFNAFTVSQAGTSPVCRFYIPPELGNSHFFGRGADECNETARKNPSFVLEDSTFMHMVLPDAGTCPSNLAPVYRAFSNRPDANHRYMSVRALRDRMTARGWLAEGDGADLVVMCGPP